MPIRARDARSGPARRSTRAAATVTVMALLASGCTPGDDDEAAPAGRTRDGASHATATPAPPTVGETAVSRMSLRQKAGQVIVASWQGTGSPARMVRRLHLGGVLALEQNLSSVSQVRSVTSSVRRVVSRRGYPAFVGVDQEGGIVNRVGAPATPFPAFMAAGAADDEALTRRAAQASARDMRALGFDVVLAPVADVSVGAADAVIGSRAAGGRPELVARQVLAAAEGIERAGVLPVVKHFPGHGSLTVDSHRDLPVQRRSLRELRAVDLVPFARAIGAGVPAIMTGHIDVRALDTEDGGVPASISRRVTTGLLRQQMGYHGLVVTDALDMDGVQQVARGGRAAVRALRAGADVVLMPPDPRKARDRIVAAVRSGRLPGARLDEATARMIDTLRALPGRAGIGRGPVGTTSGARASLALSRSSITSLAGPCHGRLIADRVRVEGPSSAVAGFSRVMTDRGVTIAKDVRKRVRTGTKSVVVGHRRVRKKVVDRHGHVTRKRKRVAIRRKVPVWTWVTIKADAPTVSLVGYGDGAPGPSDIVVALDRPAMLGGVDARVELATYGATPQALSALADVLLGTRPAPGHLPIEVPGAERDGC